MLDASQALGGSGWDGKMSDLSTYLAVKQLGGSSYLSVIPGGTGGAETVAELLGVKTTLGALLAGHALVA